jgi:hypothetical protein
MEMLVYAAIVVFAAAITVAFLALSIKKAKQISHDLWREVPPPNWRCRRGGIDYL